MDFHNSSSDSKQERQEKFKTYYEQETDQLLILLLMDFLHDPLDPEVGLPNFGYFIVELRLETKIVNENDAAVLQIIMMNLTNLQRLSLDFITYKDLGILALNSLGFQTLSLKTVGFRFHEQNLVVRRKN